MCLSFIDQTIQFTTILPFAKIHSNGCVKAYSVRASNASTVKFLIFFNLNAIERNVKPSQIQSNLCKFNVHWVLMHMCIRMHVYSFLLVSKQSSQYIMYKLAIPVVALDNKRKKRNSHPIQCLIMVHGNFHNPRRIPTPQSKTANKTRWKRLYIINSMPW